MNIFGFEITRQKEAREVSQTVETAAGGTGYSFLSLLGGTSEDVAMKLSAVYHCATIISQNIAQMPIRVLRYNKAEGVYKEFVKNDQNHLYYLLNVRPNDWMNGFQLKRAIVWDYLMKGNAYVLPVDAKGKAVNLSRGMIDHLVLISPDNVSMDVKRRLYRVSDDDQCVPAQIVPFDQMWHIRNVSANSHSFEGKSTLHYALNAINIAKNTDSEIGRRMEAGGMPKMLLRYQQNQSRMGTYDNKQLKTLADNIGEEVKNNFVTAITAEGLDVHQLGMSSADLRLIETTHVSTSQIAMFFHVPLYMLGEQTSNYKTPEEARTQFVNDCLAPICAQIESEIMAKFCDMSDWMIYRIDFDENSRYSLDVNAKATRNRMRLETGTATINELRAEEYLPPIDGGDTLLMSANLKPVVEEKSEDGGAIGADAQPMTAADNSTNDNN